MAQSPQLNDSQLNLLAKIAANTGETQPKHGDGQHNLLFKIAQNTYASAVNSSSTQSALQQSGDGYVVAQQGDSLAAKYAEAKAKSPSVTNRVTLFVVPGTYSLSSELAIDAEYVDIVGLGAQFQSPAVIVTNNTLNVTANNVRVSGISVGAQEFKIASNKPLQMFENCKGGNGSFAGNGGTASGEFVGCVGGDDSFGGYDIEQSSTASFINCIAGDDGFGGNAGDYPSAKYISCRLTSGSFPTIYIPGRARFCLDDDYNIVNADGGYDTDADSYFTTSGVTDDTAKEQLNLFVIGVKRLGLWDDMVCWPLRSAQNAGTGSTAYSLGGLGTYNGTLVNGPTWGLSGISLTSSGSQYIEAATPTINPASYIIGSVVKLETSGSGSSVIISVNGTSNADAVQVYDASSNTLGGGHRQVAGSTFVEPSSQSFTTNDFLFVQQGWDGATVRRFKNFSDEVTASSGAFAGFISPLRINSRADSILAGQNKTAAFAYLLKESGCSLSLSQSFYSLYKQTLGQGLGLP